MSLEKNLWELKFESEFIKKKIALLQKNFNSKKGISESYISREFEKLLKKIDMKGYKIENYKVEYTYNSEEPGFSIRINEIEDKNKNYHFGDDYKNHILETIGLRYPLGKNFKEEVQSFAEKNFVKEINAYDLKDFSKIFD